MSDKRGTWITCQNNSTNKRQTPGGLMSNYKHLSHHRFKLSWYRRPGVAALGEGGSHSPTAPGRPVGWHDHVPLGCLAPRMPIFHAPGGGQALQVGRQYLAPMGFLLKVLWLSNVTALILKLPPVARPDLGRRQLTAAREEGTAISGVSSLLVPFALIPRPPLRVAIVRRRRYLLA